MSKKSSDSTVDKVKKQESKYDANVLRDLIRNGKTASEIMLAMDIGHKQILKHHVLKLIATDKEFYEVPGLYDKNRRKAFVNSRGEIRLRMTNIDFKGMPLKPETEFDVVVEDNKRGAPQKSDRCDSYSTRRGEHTCPSERIMPRLSRPEWP